VGRIAAGWHLAKLSLRVVARDGSLATLVVLGGVASGATKSQTDAGPGSVVRSWASFSIRPGGMRSAAVVRT
jgi:hypothetical protein